ncbi:hypothetical protein CRM22_005479 [Opisthorchis felineus]|uniref:Secreted protein n=1 Tax=Opisthorchis felineus TaxID=147828 RepID=A0A4S2LWP3_OPIFE|nr:hypothetical protein CRM22_005479 [Opisthorchis felineus]
MFLSVMMMMTLPLICCVAIARQSTKWRGDGHGILLMMDLIDGACSDLKKPMPALIVISPCLGCLVRKPKGFCALACWSYVPVSRSAPTVSTQSHIRLSANYGCVYARPDTHCGPYN